MSLKKAYSKKVDSLKNMDSEIVDLGEVGIGKNILRFLS